MPNSTNLKSVIKNELHKNPYSGHQGYQKMITSLRKQFDWPNINYETTDYLSKCLYCQQVKV
jgi:hypothetical protein